VSNILVIPSNPHRPPLIPASQNFSFVDQETEDQVIGEEFIEVQKLTTLATSKIHLPQLQLEDEPSKAFGYGSVTMSDLDFKLLIDMRRHHQTKQAFTGVRKRQLNHTATMRTTIIHEFYGALKEAQDDTASGTGVERSTRWRTAAPGGRGGIVDGKQLDELAAGNAANAASVAAAVVKRVRAYYFLQ
jgi:hypothetical protein